MGSFINRILSKIKGVAIWGWWQGNNLGDNWIKQTMLSAFNGATLIDTNTMPHKFNRYNFVICGGGGLFIRDVPVAWKTPPRTSFGAIGLGAEFRHTNREAHALANHAAFFFVRDQHSIDCMHLERVHRSFDITFYHPLRRAIKRQTSKALVIWRSPDELLSFDDFNKYIGVSPPNTEWMNRLEHRFKEIKEDDFSTAHNYIEELTENVGFVVSGRYHGIVAAIMRGIPCIGIDLCPKIRSLMKECGIDEFCLKIGETDKIDETIVRCLDEAESISERQQEFTFKASAKIKKDVAFALRKIAEIR